MTNKVFTIPKNPEAKSSSRIYGSFFSSPVFWVKFLKEFSVRTPTKANMAPETGPWKWRFLLETIIFTRFLLETIIFTKFLLETMMFRVHLSFLGCLLVFFCLSISPATCFSIAPSGSPTGLLWDFSITRRRLITGGWLRNIVASETSSRGLCYKVI